MKMLRRYIEFGWLVLAGLCMVLISATAAHAQEIIPTTTISTTTGSIRSLADHDGFGSSVAVLDPVNDSPIFVGAPGDNGGTGAVWMLLLDDEGHIRAKRKFSPSQIEGLDLAPGDNFGSSVAVVNTGARFSSGTGGLFLAVGAPGDDEAGEDAGAIWLLKLVGSNRDVVESVHKITMGVSGFTGQLNPSDHFGSALASTNDIRTNDNEDSPALFVGAPNDGGLNGALWVVLLDEPGMVEGQHKISDQEAAAVDS